MKQIRVVAVVGPTASGKTALGVQLARHFDGEIVSADSMQVYRGMPVATAQPEPEEMAGVPHHLIGFLDPGETFSVSDYVQLAREAIAGIAGRGKLPVIVGGTGLYVDSLLQNISFAEQPQDEQLREELYRQARADGGEALYRELCEIDPEAAQQVHPHNFVRLVRAVEIYRLTGKTLTEHKRESRREPSPYQACMLGLSCRDRQVLYDRIDRRVDRMAENGLLEEARALRASGSRRTAGNAIGHKELEPYFLGEEGLEECLERVRRESRRYAKRQLTWFRRNPEIHWLYLDDFDSFDAVIKNSQKYVETFLNL